LIQKLAFAAGAALVASPLQAQAPPPPKLLVVISVDQLSGGLFDEYRPQFTGGLARIASGALFRNGSRTGPQGRTLGPLLKAHWAGSRYAVVSGEHNLDPIAGQNPDQHWFWAGTSFATDVPGARVPLVVSKANSAVAAALARPRPPLEASPSCQSRPGKGQLARAAGDSAGLAASPELDGDTLALAAGLVDEMQLGRRAGPDLVAIDLAATGNVERAHGAASEEMCLQLTELDREIGDFLSLLDGRGIDYAVALEGIGQGRVPIAFWRPGFTGASTDTPADLADIVQTLARLVELPPPEGLEGHCLGGTPAFCSQR